MAIQKHTVNGDQQGGWYCYQCEFKSRDAVLAAAHDGVKIRTFPEDPPIPVRNCDWAARDDNLGADESPVGRGRTEQEAIEELTVLLSERE